LIATITVAPPLLAIDTAACRGTAVAPPARPAAAGLPGTELTATAAQPPRSQGVRRIAAMDSDDEMMVKLFTEEHNDEDVWR
jgi:hypothetical protein